MNESYQEILEFWFSDDVRPLWFRSTPEFDHELRQRYERLYQRACEGGLDEWQCDPHGSLALVIILDQFPLNMYRGLGRAFEGESRARGVAEHAIDCGWDLQLSDEHKSFLYLPFMHSENLADQERSVALYEAAGLEHNLRFARHHREIVRRFGRFPHRNEPLGRQSTTEELEYLDSDAAFTG